MSGWEMSALVGIKRCLFDPKQCAMAQRSFYEFPSTILNHPHSEMKVFLALGSNMGSGEGNRSVCRQPPEASVYSLVEAACFWFGERYLVSLRYEAHV